MAVESHLKKCHDNDIKRKNESSFRLNPWSMMQRRAEAPVTGDAMICAECFCAKGDGNSNAMGRLPCKNPRCYFYMSTTFERVDSPSEIEVGDFTQAVGSKPSFSREVGHDRRTSRRTSSYGSDALLSSAQNESIWGYQPATAHLQPSQSSLSVATREHKLRSQSICESRNRSAAEEKARLMRARMMSVPVYVETLPGLDQDSDLIEDAFLSSPLPNFSEDSNSKAEESGGVSAVLSQHRLNIPDTGSGIGSSFSHSSSLLDWMTATKPVEHTDERVSTPSTFDMRRLSVEIASCSITKPTSSSSVLGTNVRTSPSSSPTTSALGTNVGTSPAHPNLGNKLLPSSSVTSETYSRKVFIGGLPPDIDEDELQAFFSRFGTPTVDWPHKMYSKSCIPPKGYAFLLFKEESSVHRLLLSCVAEGDKFFTYMPTGNLSRKKVEVRPWHITDSLHVVDRTQALDSRKAVFVGGVPRPLKASELAIVMNEKYGNVTYVEIDCDNDLKYPKGAARVVFSSHASYIAAVSGRFMQLNYGSFDKKIELKPYVMDGQLCDECHGVQCNGKPAPFFCGSVTCLQYFCEYCWATVHSFPGKQNHRPLMKDISADRARFNYQ